jgi:hypothetical protein
VIPSSAASSSPRKSSNVFGLSSSSVDPLSKMDNHLSSRSPPSMPVLCYLSPINDAFLSYVVLHIIFPSSLRSSLKPFSA